MIEGGTEKYPVLQRSPSKKGILMFGQLVVWVGLRIFQLPLYMNNIMKITKDISDKCLKENNFVIIKLFIQNISFFFSTLKNISFTISQFIKGTIGEFCFSFLFHVKTGVCVIKTEINGQNI